ncbi:MAG: hypothetical protein K2W96_05265 [Gemmataceae bacterium]|nr:hypothetical protein [Gemmataceae bacterium]
MAEDGLIVPAEQTDIATTLVRQWLTYGGNARLYLGVEEVDFRVEPDPFGDPRLVAAQPRQGWMARAACGDWEISEDDWPGLAEQLNRGQSAEAVTGDGLPIRLWVNPGAGECGIEPLVKRPAPATPIRDYDRMARDTVDRIMGPGLRPENREKLIRSVAGQLRNHAGKAAILEPGRVFEIRLEEKPDGSCVIGWPPPVAADIAGALRQVGVQDRLVTEALACLNSGEPYRFKDAVGTVFLLDHDPSTHTFTARSV